MPRNPGWCTSKASTEPRKPTECTQPCRSGQSGLVQKARFHGTQRDEGVHHTDFLGTSSFYVVRPSVFLSTPNCGVVHRVGFLGDGSPDVIHRVGFLGDQSSGVVHQAVFLGVRQWCVVHARCFSAYVDCALCASGASRLPKRRAWTPPRPVGVGAQDAHMRTASRTLDGPGRRIQTRKCEIRR